MPALKIGVAATDPKKERPQPGDVLVFDKGDRKDRPIAIDDVPLGDAVLSAYPMEPQSGVVRRGSRLNRALLIRLDPTTYSDETLPLTAEGIVAYSGFCTHQGCQLNDWDDSADAIWCTCHNSKFDPRERGRVVFGPAKRRLAVLPIEIQEQTLVVAAPFVGKLGVPR